MAVKACTRISTLPHPEIFHLVCFAPNKTLAIAEMELELAMTLAEEKASLAVQNLREEQKGLEELIHAEVRAIFRCVLTNNGNLCFHCVSAGYDTVSMNRRKRKYGHKRVRIACHRREKFWCT